MTKSPEAELTCQVEYVSLNFIKEVNQNLCAVRVASNIMVLALKNGYVFIINLSDPGTVHSFLLPMLLKNQEKLLDIWINPQATLVFFKTNFAKYYLGNIEKMTSEDSGTKLSTLKKLNKKNCDIQTVDWSFDEHSILLGTKEGKAYYVDLTPCVKDMSDDAKVTKVYSSTQPIDGISYNKSLGALLVTGSDISFWKSEVTAANDIVKTFVSIAPAGKESFEQSDKEYGTKFVTHGEKFAWITNSGIVYGALTDNKVLKDAKILLYVELPSSSHRIKDIRLTDYHIIILRGSEILVVNQLNMKLVFSESIFKSDEAERLISLSVDYSQDPPTIWCHSNSNVYEIVMTGEARSVWRLLCEDSQFVHALALKGLSQIEVDQIHSMYGDYYYNKKNWSKAASEYGNLKNIYDCGTVALKFMEFPDQLGSLQEYLKEILGKSEDDMQVRIVILSSWIIWNYMNELNETEELLTSSPTDGLIVAKKLRIEESFQTFVKNNLSTFDRETVYQIMSKQNRKKELLFFATLVEDYEYVLSYWIKVENWYESLKVLASLRNVSLIYKYSTILLVSAPDATINTWMKISNLEPKQLIPSILTYFTNYQGKKLGSVGSNAQNYGANYLKWCIREQGSADPLVHNTLFYMMITDRYLEREQETIQFMKSQVKLYFNKDFLLRLSLRFKKFGIAIFIYSDLELFEDAISLALHEGMLNEAKRIVAQVDDKGVKRRLWLKIASAIIHNDADMKNSLTIILHESENLLTIKDLLPLFDEFVTIANLKEELVRSLEKHNLQISNICDNIRESLKIKQEIQEDIHLFQERFETLKPGVSCSCCEEPLQTRKFFVYPCGHTIHTDCIIKEILKSNDYSLKLKIESMQKRLAAEKMVVRSDELDELLSKRCPLCSEITINSIDEPWRKDESEASKWQL